MFVNYAAKRIHLKLVLSGPVRHGGRALLDEIQRSRGDAGILRFGDEDKSIQFELPTAINIRGFSVSFQIYWLSTQWYYESTQRIILKGLDGLLVILDAREPDACRSVLWYVIGQVQSAGVIEIPLLVQWAGGSSSETGVLEREIVRLWQGTVFFNPASSGDAAERTLAGFTRLSELVVEQISGRFKGLVQPPGGTAPKRTGLQRPGSGSGTARRLVKVFVAHASEDKPRVRPLVRKLQEEGYEVWFDEESLLPGTDWKVEIQIALSSADVVLICLSPLVAEKRGFIQKEIRYALELLDEVPDGQIFAIPVRMEKCEVPRQLQKLHWVDLFEAQGYLALLKSLGKVEERARKNLEVFQAAGGMLEVGAPKPLEKQLKPGGPVRD